MKFTIIEPEPAEWDRFVEKQGGHILQTSNWGRLKTDFGWQAERIALRSDTGIVAGALVLYRRLPFGPGTLAYVPRGPVVDWADTQTVEALLSAIDEAAHRRRAILLKLEPDLPDTPANRDTLAGLGFHESVQTVQPPRTILIDISGSEDDILARMNQGTRRKIRTAAKKDVVVEQNGEAGIDAFNALMAVTGERNEFGVHSDAYYRRVADLFIPQNATLLLARYGDQTLAGLVAFASGDIAWYFYGASSNVERNRMPAYALQWEAICWARERGCTVYDMWGVPDADVETLEDEFQDRQDGLWGVYGFKRGFGGEVVRAVGAWDRVYRPLLYNLYTLAIRLRR
ncbi:MAG: peptidoglycan bridge formation glycyltransferase FemA/FemB family protein [Anaerolineae bacterium]|nr:peptidoglycan bridge formation glycyltransferase FemA/FemB family protein [Anaerolineae bacterium]